jgi:hypothetical protein
MQHGGDALRAIPTPVGAHPAPLRHFNPNRADQDDSLDGEVTGDIDGPTQGDRDELQEDDLDSELDFDPEDDWQDEDEDGFNDIVVNLVDADGNPLTDDDRRALIEQAGGQIDVVVDVNGNGQVLNWTLRQGADDDQQNADPSADQNADTQADPGANTQAGAQEASPEPSPARSSNTESETAQAEEEEELTEQERAEIEMAILASHEDRRIHHHHQHRQQHERPGLSQAGRRSSLPLIVPLASTSNMLAMMEMMQQTAAGHTAASRRRSLPDRLQAPDARPRSASQSSRSARRGSSSDPSGRNSVCVVM